MELFREDRKVISVGLTLNVNYSTDHDVIMVALNDPLHTSFFTNADNTELFIAIRKANLSVLRQLLDELNPQPARGFWFHIREGFRLLNKPTPETEVIPHVGLNEIVRN